MLQQAVSWLVSWCFEPSQPQRITSGLKTNFSLSPSYSLNTYNKRFSGNMAFILCTRQAVNNNCHHTHVIKSLAAQGFAIYIISGQLKTSIQFDGGGWVCVCVEIFAFSKTVFID